MDSASEIQSSKMLFRYVAFTAILAAFGGALVYTLTGNLENGEYLVISLGVMLVLLTVIFSVPNSLLKIRMPGFEAVFDAIVKEAKEVRTSEPPEAVRRRLADIEQVNDELAGTFLRLALEIETKLRSVGEEHGIPKSRMIPLGALVHGLVRKEVISDQLAAIVEDFRMIRNRVMHEKIALNEKNLEDAISVAGIVLTELEKGQ
jgi:hypothetical protein